MGRPTEPRSFPTTRWSTVKHANGVDGEEARRALSSLCELYWYPIYAFYRRAGKSPHDAEDLTQSFFGHLVSHDVLASADPTRGRMRSFLLACARNHLADARTRESAQKRGGTVPTISLDVAEAMYVTEPVDLLTPDRLYQRRWAVALLERTLDALKAEYADEGKEALFDSLRPFLGFTSDPESRYEEIAATLGVPVGTLKNRVFRMRERWRHLLFEEVGATLEDPTPENIRDELSELLGYV